MTPVAPVGTSRMIRESCMSLAAGEPWKITPETGADVVIGHPRSSKVDQLMTN